MSPGMKCAQRVRLGELLRIATDELSCIYMEEVRIARELPHRFQEFEEVVKAAEAIRKDALDAFMRHVMEHDCQ